MSHSSKATIFLGSGFAAKYRVGGGCFSVPLQWALGLKKLNKDFFWLELLPASKDPDHDRACIETFRRQMRAHGLEKHYVLLYQNPPEDAHHLEKMHVYGALTRAQLEDRLAGPTTLLNLSYSFHPPFVLQFERRILCDLDPTEIAYWMQTIEMGQSTHHEFWTIGLNIHAENCALPKNNLEWKTFYPLVDTDLNRLAPPPRRHRFTTIGQWYWANNIPLNGDYCDLSKKVKFEKFMTLPRLVPNAELELAMNINPGDPERERVESYGWKIVEPHNVAKSPAIYRRYLRSASGEFTTIKGVDVLWQSGWVSDRAAAFLATGRPVITEDAGVSRYLSSGSDGTSGKDSGFFEVQTLEEASEAMQRVIKDWTELSKKARACGEEFFEATKNLKRILGE